MDSALRTARLLKFCSSTSGIPQTAGAGSNSSAAVHAVNNSAAVPAGNSSAAVPAANSSVDVPDVNISAAVSAGNSSAAVLAGAQIAAIDPVQVLNLLVQIKSILENLPEAIAAAVVANTSQEKEVVQAAQNAQAPQEQLPIADGHDGDEPPEEACGVCHMPVAIIGIKWAFDNCGHYPYCTPCVEQLKKNACCPYCSVKGEAVALKLD